MNNRKDRVSYRIEDIDVEALCRDVQHPALDCIDDETLEDIAPDLHNEILRNKSGRPAATARLLTQEKASKILDLVSKGVRPKTAFMSLGMSPMYYDDLKQKSQLYPGKYQIAEQLLADIQAAEGEARMNVELALAKFTQEDWRAALAYLERTDRETWAKQPETVIVNSNSMTVSLDDMTDEQLAAIARGQTFDMGEYEE